MMNPSNGKTHISRVQTNLKARDLDDMTVLYVVIISNNRISIPNSSCD